MGKFELFLINEERSYLGHRVSNVLTAVQDVQQDMPNLGSRHLVKIAEELVNQIRKILHSNWSPKYYKYLKDLQKVAVAIMRTIDEKGDLKELIPTATQSLQDLSSKLGVKVNSLEAPENIVGQDASQDDFQLTGNGPEDKQQITATQQPNTV